jgi:hypothetical protein
MKIYLIFHEMGAFMECPRCNGLMIAQSFVHALAEPEAWKCINCGNVLSKKEKTLEFDSFSMFYHQQKQNKNNK